MPSEPAAAKSPFFDLRVMWSFGWWARLDCIGHMLNLPWVIQRHLCDRFERSLDDSYWFPPSPTMTTSSNQTVQTTWTWSRDRRRHRG